MTTLAKVEANRANGKLSTGPKSPAGKAAAARNAVRHGLLSAAPVVAGEDPAAWERHRADVTASLAPAGAVEQQLAARAALLLWRLARVARFEAAAVGAGLDAALLPRPPADELLGGFRPAAEDATAKARATARREAADARKAAARLTPRAEYLASLPARPDDEAVPADVAVGVLEAAYDVLFRYELAGDPPPSGGKAFLARLGRAEKAADRVPWTAGLVRRGLGVYAEYADDSADWLLGEARAHLARELRRHARTARRRGREAAGLAERLARLPAWRAADALIPKPEAEARVVRYDAHLSRQLAATLRDLERLQAARTGRPRKPRPGSRWVRSAEPPVVRFDLPGRCRNRRLADRRVLAGPGRALPPAGGPSRMSGVAARPTRPGPGAGPTPDVAVSPPPHHGSPSGRKNRKISREYY